MRFLSPAMSPRQYHPTPKPRRLAMWLSWILLPALPVTMFSAEKAWIADRAGDWHDPANWSPPGVPSTTDTVRIESGSVRLAQPVIIEGRLDWSGGRIHSGGIDIAPTGELNLLGGADKLLTAVTLNNGGLVRWQDTGRLIGSFTGFGQSVLITNLPGGEWSIQTDTNLLFSSPGLGGEFFLIHNSGTLRKTAGPGTTALEGPIQFRNTGLVAVDQGQLRFQQPITSEGRFTVAAGAAVELTAGRIDLLPGHVADGEGFFGLREGTLNLFGTVHGRFDWTGGRLADSDLRVATDGRLLLDGAADKLLTAGTLNNEGLFNWAGAGRLIGSFTGFGQSVLITNLPGGEWSIQTDTNLLFSSPGLGGEFFHIQNDGLIQQTTPDGAVRFQGPIGLNNQGELKVDAGQLILEGGLTQNGTLNVAESASLQVIGGQFELGADNVFVGTGTVEIPSGSVQLNGTLNGKLRVTGGTVTGSSTLRGTLDWLGGQFISGSIEVATNGVVNLLGDTDKVLTQWTLNNGGLIRWQDAGRLIGSFTGFGQSVLITNLASGLFQVESDADLLLSSPGHGGELMRFSNAGDLVKLGGSATNSFIGVPTFNSGTMVVATGALDFPAGLSNEGLIIGSARIEFSPPAVFPPTEPLTLILHGISGLKYRVEASVDLATWEEIALTNALASTFQLLDPGAVGATVRCYRATVAPAN
ncbi:MAG: hypothetical protein KJ072_16605 [Verrucomicrobia bacterium]|nr:hypothetical protein [Verrucomicrobiota bacterium]